MRAAPGAQHHSSSRPAGEVSEHDLAGRRQQPRTGILCAQLLADNGNSGRMWNGSRRQDGCRQARDFILDLEGPVPIAHRRSSGCRREKHVVTRAAFFAQRAEDKWRPCPPPSPSPQTGAPRTASTACCERAHDRYWALTGNMKTWGHMEAGDLRGEGRLDFARCWFLRGEARQWSVPARVGIAPQRKARCMRKRW